MNTKVASIVSVILFSVTSSQKENLTKPSSLSAQTIEKLSTINDSIYIGAHYGGGIIFWIDSTGEHGLIAAPSDFRRFLNWYNFWTGYVTTGATRKIIGSGEKNTKMVLKAQRGDGCENTYKYAAVACARFNIDGYTDWYLPSLNELMEMYKLRDIIGGFSHNYAYWCSTEFDQFNAYRIYFGEVPLVSYYDKGNWHKVRAVRTF